jgi:hypothetical protein
MGKVIGMLGLLGVLGYIQNMAFTWSSRTRNQNDTKLHRYAAWCSNGVWFLMQMTIWGTLWTALTHDSLWVIAATGLVYTLSTTEGSVRMMELLIKRGK